MKKRVTFEELMNSGSIPWKSWKTTKRKIVSESFPAYFECGRYYFDLAEVELWWKKRKAA